MDASDIVTVLRLYNEWTGEHLFTTDQAEYDALVKDGWSGENVAWYSPSDPNVGEPVYRIYNQWSGDHYYTKDHAEAEQRVSEGWQWDEGGKPLFYSVKNTDSNVTAYPIYQLFNQYVEIGTHHWTTKESEYEACKARGWNGENVKFYASALPPETSNPGGGSGGGSQPTSEPSNPGGGGGGGSQPSNPQVEPYYWVNTKSHVIHGDSCPSLKNANLNASHWKKVSTADEARGYLSKGYSKCKNCSPVGI